MTPTILTLLLLGAEVQSRPAAPPVGPANAAQEDDEPDDLVVTGRRTRGTAPTTVPPEVRLSSRAIRAIGVTTVAEVLEQIAPQLRGGGTRGAAAVLVNGRRVAQTGEIDDVPPEAISRIDVFPSAAAAALGFGAGQRVVNIVLKRRYRAATITARPTVPLGGGRRSYQARLDGTRIAGDARAAATVELRRNEATYERGALGEPDRTRTVRPLLDRTTANLVLARAGTTGSLRLATEDARSGYGLVGQQARRATITAGIALNRGDGARSWSLTATLAADRTQTRTGPGIGPRNIGYDIPIATLWRSCGGACVTGAMRSLTVESYVRRPLTTGPRAITGTLTLQGGVAAIAAHPGGYGTGARDREARRGELGVRAGVEIPLADDPTRLRLDAQAGLHHASDAGDLPSANAGVEWQPGAFTFDARYALDRVAPSLERLGAPLLATPAVRLYDFAGGRPALATLTVGGNTELRPTTERLLTLRAQWVAAGLSLEWTDRHSRAPLIEAPAPTAAIERAFPGRAARDAAGTLMAFDARPLSASRSERRELTLGLNRTASAAGTDLRIGLYHRWRWRDRIALVGGGPMLDLLNGAAVDAEGGTPRHVIEANGSVGRNGVSMYLAADWAGAGRVRDAIGGETRVVRPLRLDLRLLVDLRKQGWLVRRWPGAAGILNLSIDNVLDRRTSFRSGSDDGSGSYDLDRLSNAGTGRTIRVTLRKRFS